MEKYKLLGHLFIFLTIFSSCHTNETINIKLKQGDLSGTIEKTFLKKQDYYAFRGIPYAEPPIGRLRFKVNY